MVCTTKEQNQAITRWVARWLDNGRGHFKRHLNADNGLDKIAETACGGAIWALMNEIIKSDCGIKVKESGEFDPFNRPIYDLDMD